NPLVKRIRQLADRRHRRREGAFVVDGVQPVWRAVEAGADVELLVIAPELLRGSPAMRMVEERRAAGVRVAQLSGELFTRLSERDGPSGLAAIVRARMRPLDDVAAGPDAVFVVLHEVGNPGNLGTIIRTADATGATGVVLIGDASDPYAPAAVKSSMGSLFAVDVSYAATVDAFFAWARARAVQIVATSGGAADRHWDAAYRRPLALLFGSEGPGLPAAAVERSDLRVRIPMVGTAESLNLAAAAAVMLYEVQRAPLAESGA
ncbi:MAG TPA: RNA methyltransferase, partial [Micromonosporaceae bacterium]|nr:RNA methyltransferase [Micromonosporaceae bacterium]